MSDLLDKQIVVRLNKSWQAVGVTSVRQSITFLCSEHNGERPGFALDFEVATDENGNQVIVYAQPVSWEDWVKLLVRPGDLSLTTSRGPIRVPLIVICAKYNKVPTRTDRLSSGNIMKRDGGVCQYTGEKVGRGQGNLDHVVPRDRGGRDSWENLVWCKRSVNTEKGNRLNREAGLKLIRQPKAPMPTPVIIRKAAAPMPAQAPFLLD